MTMRRSWQTSLNIFGKKLSSRVGHISYQGVFYIIFTNLYKIRHGQMFSKIKFYTRKNYTQKPSPTHSKIIKFGLKLAILEKIEICKFKFFWAVFQKWHVHPKTLIKYAWKWHCCFPKIHDNFMSFQNSPKSSGIL